MGRNSDGFWTAPPARRFTQLWKRRSHPRARSHRGRQPPIGAGKLPTPTHSFLPQCPGPGPGRTGSAPHSSARPGMQRRTGSAEAADPARRGPGALGRSRRPGAGAGGRRGYPGSSCSTVREPHEAGLVRIQRLPLPGVRARSPVWRSEMRLSSRLERRLVERMVQNASESARIRPDPAQIAKLRRILDHPRAVPPGWGETQTGFGPPPPGARRFTQL